MLGATGTVEARSDSKSEQRKNRDTWKPGMRGSGVPGFRGSGRVPRTGAEMLVGLQRGIVPRKATGMSVPDTTARNV